MAWEACASSQSHPDSKQIVRVCATLNKSWFSAAALILFPLWLTDWGESRVGGGWKEISLQQQPPLPVCGNFSAGKFHCKEILQGHFSAGDEGGEQLIFCLRVQFSVGLWTQLNKYAIKCTQALPICAHTSCIKGCDFCALKLCDGPPEQWLWRSRTNACVILVAWRGFSPAHWKLDGSSKWRETERRKTMGWVLWGRFGIGFLLGHHQRACRSVPKTRTFHILTCCVDGDSCWLSAAVVSWYWFAPVSVSLHPSWVTWTLSELPPPPLTENFQLGHCLTWILSNLDIVCLTPPSHSQKIFNLDIVQLGHCLTWTLSEFGYADIVWVGAMQTLSE